jgi:hypothetical protein
LQSKNPKLKNGMDAVILGVLRSKTPKGQTAPAGRPAVWIPGFLQSKNPKLKNGMEAIFEQRKG